MPRGNGHRGHRQGQPPPPNLAPCTPLSTHVPTQWPWRGRYDVFGNIPDIANLSHLFAGTPYGS